jgi:iron complex outermembrane receptor protein
MNAELRTAISSVDRGTEGAVLLDAGGGNVALHADVYGRRAGDYNVPSYPYAEPGLPFSGRQPNSSAHAEGGSTGGSYLFDGGFIGAAITQNNSLYRIPGTEGAELGTRIDAKQTKVNVKGEYRPDAAAIEAIRFWLGATDYKHNEIGLGIPGDPASDGVRQTFTNKEQEGRVELQLAPFNARFATVTTALGLQASHQELTAPSPDDPGSPLNGLFDPNKNTKLAAYVFNELRFTDSTKAQIAGRVERVDLSGTSPAFVPELFDLNTNPADIGPATARNLSFTPKSFSLGLIQALPWDLTASITGQYVERAPKPAELFSRGGHDATATFDIGNPNLTIETAKSVEIGLRRATGPLRFEITAYYTQFSGFIYRRLTSTRRIRALRSNSIRRSIRSATPPSRAANSRASSMSARFTAAFGASRASSTWCAPLSPTAPTCRGFRRCAPAAACSGATPTGSPASACCTPSPKTTSLRSPRQRRRATIC